MHAFVLLFGLTTVAPQQREEVLSDTRTLRLLVPASLMALVVPAARSVAMRALVHHLCAKSGGLSCPLRYLTLLKQPSHIFSTADCPAGIKHVAERSDNILNHCRLLLCEGMPKVWLIQPGIQNSLIRIPIILRMS